MRELDQLLGRCLDRLLREPDRDQALDRFERLLDCEDDQLWRWCLGQGRPDDAGLAELLDALRADPAA
ncbi:MAG: succinate dehydrogenase assembly factor 2 [Xanthomonadales bacterium]|nr:succinate dehydrogenase assembly factor 2 [Xanthomonadales bacterium]